MPICASCENEKDGKHPIYCKKCRNKRYFEKKSKECPYCDAKYLWNGAKTHCSNKCNILDTTVISDKGCWEWQKGCDDFGYGQIRHDDTGKGIHTHRRSYEIFKGEIPKGQFVCHSCDNPKCCNPEHLWLGDCKENMEDCANKGRTYHQTGEKHYSATLTDDQVRSIRKEYKEGISRKELAKKYDQSLDNIHKIIQGKSWQHLL